MSGARASFDEAGSAEVAADAEGTGGAEVSTTVDLARHPTSDAASETAYSQEHEIEGMGEGASEIGACAFYQSFPLKSSRSLRWRSRGAATRVHSTTVSRRAVRSLLIAGLLASAVLELSGCQRSTARPPVTARSGEPATVLGVEPAVHSLGELAEARDYQMSIDSIDDCLVPPPFAPKPDDVKLGVDVMIAGTTTNEVPANPFYALLYDEAGGTYESTLAGCEPPLVPRLVTRGENARGFITFEVPKTARTLTMRYAPLIIGRGPEELRFSIPR